MTKHVKFSGNQNSCFFAFEKQNLVFLQALQGHFVEHKSESLLIKPIEKSNFE